jgi:hypothetical protein
MRPPCQIVPKTLSLHVSPRLDWSLIRILLLGTLWHTQASIGDRSGLSMALCNAQQARQRAIGHSYGASKCALESRCSKVAGTVSSCDESATNLRRVGCSTRARSYLAPAAPAIHTAPAPSPVGGSSLSTPRTPGRLCPDRCHTCGSRFPRPCRTLEGM